MHHCMYSFIRYSFTVKCKIYPVSTDLLLELQYASVQ